MSLNLDLNGTSSSGENSTAVFTEQVAVQLMPNAVFTSDNGQNRGDLITISLPVGYATSEMLFLSQSGLSIALANGVNVSFDSGILKLDGANKDPAVWQSLLREVYYNNTSDAPANSSRVIEVKALDRTTNDLNTVTVNVTPVNDAPVVAKAVADQSSAEDTAWSFVVPAGTFSDVDGETLTYSGSGPIWVRFDAATQTFSGTPPKDFNGKVSLTVTASDGKLSVSDSFDLTITP
ncbi:putative Ig domain-containing protein, partial [Microvirga aerophila]|uniref:putative Ig domain-containing protein n=1 Tax=Microvirga aerophila TaxID=670291 RepID=UPI0011BF0350